MYTLKSIARRGTTLGMAVGLLIAAFIPTASVFADALNPLTERSLLLSSSAPGWQDTDGSGNSTYAPPGSGPNGKKTGQTFKFKVSSGLPISGMSLQYCTKAAGHCQAPGNNTGDFDPADDGSVPSTRILNETPTTGGWALQLSDLNVQSTFTEVDAATVPGEGEFVVLVDGVQSEGWTMTALNAESEDTALPGGDVELTGKNNMIHLTKTAGGAQALANGDVVEVIFEPSDSIFITNPGSKEFFVKINTYNTADTDEFIPTVPYGENNSIVDGGVTVANVMTDSIHITTKVLETMSFSVGTKNPDTSTYNCVGYPSPATIEAGCKGVAAANLKHGPCDVVQQINNNRLNLGDPNAEYSLSTSEAYETQSYWRLSSNSSGGASVYYSGNTLANTVGDEIAPMATKTASAPGQPQFGLGYLDAGADTQSAEYIADQTAAGRTGLTANSAPFRTLTAQTGADYPNEAAQATTPDGYGGTLSDYMDATGTIDDGNIGPGTAQFKFRKESLTVPALIAQQNDEVISCSTAKMRYVANIGADTPAGVYTTKVNYLAAPQY